MVNSHNKVITGILFKTYTGIAEYQEDHHSYRCNFATVPNHSDSHYPISTASDQLARQFHFWLWVSWRKNSVVNKEGFDFQYECACQIFFESVVHTENLRWLASKLMNNRTVIVPYILD